jgi:hypothetical protein
MRFIRASLVALVLAGPLLGADPAPPPAVVLPAEVRADVGRLAAVKVEYAGEDLRYDVPPELDCFREYDPNPKVWRLRLIGYAPGKYRLLAVTCGGGRLSDFASCTVTIGTPVPPVPPTPPTPPVPPAPIPGDGLRVLILYETGQSVTPGQQAALYGKTVRDYLDAHCVADPEVKGWRAYRIWDKDTVASKEAKWLQDALARPHASVPWIVISNGKDGFEGPLPATADETLSPAQEIRGQLTC